MLMQWLVSGQLEPEDADDRYEKKIATLEKVMKRARQLTQIGPEKSGET